jgi:hypothetical protein
MPRPIAARRGADDEIEGEQRLAGARRAEDQDAGAALDAAAEQSVQPHGVAGHDRPLEFGLVLQGNEAGEDLHAAGFDHEVVIAAAIAPAAIFDDPEAAALGAIVPRQFLETDHAMRHAVHSLVGRVGGEVVEQQHRRLVAGEIMFQRQDLAAVAERTLRQQPDFGQAVEHDAIRPSPLERSENPPGGLA